MRTVKFIDLITQSVDESRRFLLEPFEMQKWLKLIWIGIVAGTLVGGGFPTGYLQGTGRSDESKQQRIEQSPNALHTKEQPVGRVKSSHRIKKEIKGAIRKGLKQISEYSPRVKMLVICVIIFISAGLQLFVMWLNARFRFVWLHAVIRQETSISRPFRQYRKQGDSFFKLALVAFGLFAVFFGLCIWWVYSAAADWGTLKVSGIMSAELWRGLIAFVTAVVAGLIVLNIWYVFVDHFVLPIMMLDDCTYLPAWNKFCKIYTDLRAEFWKFLLVIFIMGFICSMIEGLVTFMIILASIVLIAVTYGIGFLIFMILLKAKIIFIGFAIGAGIPLLAGLIVVMFAIGLPFAIFFRYFSLFFLTSLNAGYAPLDLRVQGVE